MRTVVWGEKLFVAATVIQHTQRVERPETGRQLELPAPREQVDRWSEVPPSESCIELRQKMEQPIDVLRRATMDDIQILGRDWRAVHDGGSSTYDDELDAGPQESLNERVEISLSGMRHS